MCQWRNAPSGYALREWLRFQLANGVAQLQRPILPDGAPHPRGHGEPSVCEGDDAALSHPPLGAIPVKQMISKPAGATAWAIAPSITYVSAIAHVLARAWGESPLTLAQHLQSILQGQLQGTPAEERLNPGQSVRTTCNEPVIFLASLAPHWSIQVTPPGWLMVRLHDSGLAIWLQWLAGGPWAETPERTSTGPIKPVTPEQQSVQAAALFPVQLTHARCCSLLRLAVREGMLALSSSDPGLEVAMDTADGAIASPNPLPWLQADQTLCLRHPLEQDLIAKLVAAADCLWDAAAAPTQESLVKQAIALASSFQSFDAGCRMFGCVRTVNLPRAQARLGLVLATRRMLHLILGDGLGVETPTEL